jgi:hypothetical protein
MYQVRVGGGWIGVYVWVGGGRGLVSLYSTSLVYVGSVSWRCMQYSGGWVTDDMDKYFNLITESGGTHRLRKSHLF